MYDPTHTQKLIWREELLELVPRGGVVAELGVQRGYFAGTMDHVIKPRELWAIDCWQHQQGPYEQDRANAPQAEQDRLFKFVSVCFSGRPNCHVLRAFTTEAVKQFPDGYFDLVYLDACHLYDAVRQDLADWWPKVREGGLFCGHDYWEVNVPWIGVRRAVDEFCIARGRSLDYITLGHCGSWGLWKR